MEFAIAYPARPDAWKDLVIAEDHGFTHAWFYDSQLLYSDVFVCLALAAEHTKRIKLGPGVAIPSNRIEPVTAHSIATINQLAPGRAMLGVGTGFTGRNTMGCRRFRSIAFASTYKAAGHCCAAMMCCSAKASASDGFASCIPTTATSIPTTGFQFTLQPTVLRRSNSRVSWATDGSPRSRIPSVCGMTWSI